MEKFYWLNEDSRIFLSRGYLKKDQTAEERIKEIADKAEEYLGIEGYADKFYDYMSRGFYSLSSPVWANYGKKRGLPVSCFGSFIDDNMESILYGHAENGMLMKNGGGTSGFFGAVRERGAPISDQGESSGSVHFMQMYDTLASVVSQGSVRRGFFSAYLPIEHSDADEFLDIGTEGHPIQGLTTGITVSNEFLKKVLDGDSDARRIWAKVLQRRSEIGFPYIFFTDNVNDGKPDVYKDLKMQIHASNMCVTGDTKILTDKGYVTIQDVSGTEVNVWNGEEFSLSKVEKTGSNQELIEIKFSNGQTLKCTPYHKFYNELGEEIRAKDLKIGTKMIKHDLPVIDNYKTIEGDWYATGFYAGDGCKVGNNSRIYLYGNKKSLFENFKELAMNIIVQDEYDRIYFNYPVYDVDKSFVPYGDYSLKDKLAWLEGLSDSDGTLVNNNGSLQVQISSVNDEFIKNVHLMLQTMGCQSKISTIRESGNYELPDGNGGLKNYDCKTVYRINISSYALNTLVSLGFSPKRIDLTEIKNADRNASRFVYVSEISEIENDDTYCFNEPKKHMGMFNGILTGQCSEIALPSSIDETFTCVLSSINLLHWDEIVKTDAIETMVYFLDTVVTEFINKTEGKPYFERANRFAKNHRALGMGVLGWHSYLQSNMIAFESVDAAQKNLDISKELNKRAYEASAKLADLFGEPELLKGYGRRNTTLLAVAPTKSSSFILGQVSQSIEPEFSNCYVKDLAKLKVTIKNPYLKKLLEEKGKDTPDVWDSIKNVDGSVQHLVFLTPEEKAVFKTFSEIDPYAIIDQAATRQKYIDQAQSLNLMLDPDTTVKDINALYLYAWQSGVKSLYYSYSMSKAQSLTRKKISSLDCASCEG